MPQAEDAYHTSSERTTMYSNRDHGIVECPQLRCRCRVVALDMRGHGETRTGNDRDLSSETLAQVGGSAAAAVAHTPLAVCLI